MRCLDLAIWLKKSSNCSLSFGKRCQTTGIFLKIEKDRFFNPKIYSLQTFSCNIELMVPDFCEHGYINPMLCGFIDITCPYLAFIFPIEFPCMSLECLLILRSLSNLPINSLNKLFQNFILKYFLFGLTPTILDKTFVDFLTFQHSFSSPQMKGNQIIITRK